MVIYSLCIKQSTNPRIASPNKFPQWRRVKWIIRPQLLANILHQTNSSPLKTDHPERSSSNHRFFRGYLTLPGRNIIFGMLNPTPDSCHPVTASASAPGHGGNSHLKNIRISSIILWVKFHWFTAIESCFEHYKSPAYYTLHITLSSRLTKGQWALVTCWEREKFHIASELPGAKRGKGIFFGSPTMCWWMFWWPFCFTAANFWCVISPPKKGKEKVYLLVHQFFRYQVCWLQGQ